MNMVVFLILFCKVIDIFSDIIINRKCGIITLNLGLIEHVEIPSLTYDEVVDCIENLIVDWYSSNPVMTNLTLEHLSLIHI